MANTAMVRVVDALVVSAHVVVEHGVCETSVHEAGKLNEEWWARQRFIGLQAIDEEVCLEMRNCCAPGCDSTMAIVVAMTPERVVQIEESRRRAREFSRMIDAARLAVHA